MTVSTTKTAQENGVSWYTVTWYALSGTDFGTGYSFENDAVYGLCADGTIVDRDSCPIAESDYRYFAVKNSLQQPTKEDNMIKIIDDCVKLGLFTQDEAELRPAPVKAPAPAKWC